MSDWNIKDLEEWDDKIIELAKTHNLDWFPISYEICDYYAMIGNMAYHGMPLHYRHWSYGKSFERTHQMYNLGAEGLPYELIINSDPSIAYLMRENPFYLQLLIMCHCVGHSDFFKNNLTFANTGPENVIQRFKNAKKRIDSYIEDPSIGIEKVERILDAAHALSLHIPPNCKEYVPHKKRRKDLIKRIKSGDESVKKRNPDQFPIDEEIDLLSFISEMSINLEDWERDLIDIVRAESSYFMPQIRTKIMNEGWASFWHYRLMNDLDLPQKYHIPFLKSHNQVVTPHLGRINPYHLGFHLFNKIEERYGLEECFIAREVCHDESFLRQYLTEEDCFELNLFSYSLYKRDYVINEISDGEGWKEIKSSLIKQIGSNSIPKIIVKEVKPNNVLRIHHEHDGRDLELGYAEKVVDYISTLWGGVVRLDTVIEDEPFEI